MMGGIVKRLRENDALGWFHTDRLLRDAADEIERLREALNEIAQHRHWLADLAREARDKETP